ncbi:hypothetical protein CAEBREN_25481 [Caenorhabditis brenneri]|uniref:Uncharacterized protein n=1 Tax=Caenorhabditis brenneri TaxID=135651 RepID=G0N7J5_CAEBE|nr:hypothetical protein CAEBREN_25481 [Caenorhabditis brenneri]
MEIYRDNAEVGFGIRSSHELRVGNHRLHQLTDIRGDAKLYNREFHIDCKWQELFKKKK